jgi:hypothetical protein
LRFGLILAAIWLLALAGPASAQRADAASEDVETVITEEAVETPGDLVDEVADRDAAVETEPKPPRTYRLGFWVLDFLAVDLAPTRTALRVLDFKIISLLKVGAGDLYHEVGFVEMPYLLGLFATRRDGPENEFRVIDVEAIAAAIVRHKRESPNKVDTHVLRLPIVGGLYEHRIDGNTERHTYLYAFRRQQERTLSY